MRIRPHVVNVRLDARELTQVRNLAASHDFSLGRLIREALKAFIEKEKRSSSGSAEKTTEAHATQ